MIEDGIYAAALNPDRTLGPPAEEPPVPYFNFAPLRNAADRLEAAAEQFDAATANNTVASAEINQLLYSSERLLTREAGLQGRPWYKHFLYAPGFYTGYGVKTIPGVREAIEQREYARVDPQIEIAAEVLNRMSERIERLTTMINSEH